MVFLEIQQLCIRISYQMQLSQRIGLPIPGYGCQPTAKTGSPPRGFLTILIDIIAIISVYTSMRYADSMGGRAASETTFLGQTRRKVWKGKRIVVLPKRQIPQKNRVVVL